MAKRQFTVEFTTKGAFDIEIFSLDTESLDINALSSDDMEDIMYGSDYLAVSALGDAWEGPFSLKVYDENRNVVYQSEDFCDFRFITAEEDVLDEEDPSQNAGLQIAAKEWEKRWATERDAVAPGIYAVGRHEMKWRTYRFFVEDEKFCPEKLFFVDDKRLEGIVYDYMTEPGHIFYDDRFVETEDCDDCSYEYGTYFYIMERCEDGFWKEIREIED